MKIRIHDILYGSCANGPGIRNVVWFRGCTLNCPGCFNMEAQKPSGGKLLTPAQICSCLLDRSRSCGGITISGGEPFQQPEGMLELLKLLHEKQSPPILVFSGYPRQTLFSDPALSPCLEYIDALICGPFRADLPPAYERFCSSANQELILLSERYQQQDFADLPLREWIIDSHGNTAISGIFS